MGLKKLVCLVGAVGGLLLAMLGMFSFSLWRIFIGLSLYILSGYLWERSNTRRAA